MTTSGLSRRRRRFILSSLSITAVLWLLMRHRWSLTRWTASYYATDGHPYGEADQPWVPEQMAPRIPLEAHIMSKCPDARDCLRELIVPTMEKVSNQVSFNISFIGS